MKSIKSICDKHAESCNYPHPGACDLARDIASDKDFPTRIRAQSSLTRYLETKGACDGALNIVPEFMVWYQGAIR